MVDRLREFYDYIIIDCNAPSLGMRTINALACADSTDTSAGSVSSGQRPSGVCSAVSCKDIENCGISSNMPLSNMWSFI